MNVLDWLLVLLVLAYALSGYVMWLVKILRRKPEPPPAA